MTALRSVPAVSTRPPGNARTRWAGAAVFLVVLALLFAAWLRLSRTYPENSDEANILLMAGDLAHGNWNLSGWTVSDVPFITTELPEIAVLVRLFGLHLDTAHIAAALTYTVVAGTAMLLAASSARRGPGHPLVRMAVVLAIMGCPQPGVGVFVLLFSVGHIGTAAPVMLTWLFLDRWWPAGAALTDSGAPAPRTAWWIPLTAGAMLTWALLADPLVLVIAVLPVLVTAAVRVARELLPLMRNGARLRLAAPVLARRWLELSLAAAAAAAYLAAWCGRRLLRATGGYAQPAVPYRLDPVSTWYPHARTVAHGLLTMFGAFVLPGDAVNHLGPGNYAAGPPLTGFTEALAVSRLACVVLAAAGAAAAARRFFRADADPVGQLLLAGLVANLVAYIPSSLASATALNAREIAPVLPFAAVLAARTLGDRLAWPRAGQPGLPRPGLRAAGRHRRRDRVLAGALAALSAWYCLGLLAQARLPAAPDPFTRLGAFLEAHHLRAGIGGYWDASVITVGTGGAVTIRAVTAGCAQPYAWESKRAWYDPAAGNASFLLTSDQSGYFSRWLVSPAAAAGLARLLRPGRPAAVSPGGGYEVSLYQGNLLAALPRLAHC